MAVLDVKIQVENPVVCSVVVLKDVETWVVLVVIVVPVDDVATVVVVSVVEV